MLVLLLYSFGFSSFNEPLDIGLLFFILLTSVVSLIFGIAYKKEFKFNTRCKLGNKDYIPVIIISIATIIEFICMKQVPLFAVLIFKNAKYQSFHPIPMYHVILITSVCYFSLKYFCCLIYDKKNRKNSFLYLISMLCIFALYNYRSFILIFIFMALNIYLEYLKKKKIINKKHILLSILIVIIGLYFFGILGNLRQHQKWNDCSYIEEIGLYNYFPSFIPKEYMWAYSYITSPLANLNYNIKNSNFKLNFISAIGEIFPETISKRIQSSSTKPILIKKYFNVSTGWVNSYNNGSYIGMYFLFSYLCFLGFIGLKIKKQKKQNANFLMFCSYMTVIFSFMFFDNMISYVGTSLPFWITFIILYRGRKI